jgi:hypothetical protein
MRNELLGIVGLASAVVFASVAIAACSSDDSTGSTGGGAGSGGTVGTGGSSNSGGAAGSDGGGSSVTTVSGTKAVNALAAAEVTQLCNDTYAYFGTAIPKATTCKWKGLSYAASSSAPSQTVLQQNCTNQQNACQQGGDPWANNPGCNAIPSSCAATVAQYSACISDEVAAFSQLVDQFPMCAALTLSDSAAINNALGSGMMPASCTSLADACPDLTPPTPLSQ